MQYIACTDALCHQKTFGLIEAALGALSNKYEQLVGECRLKQNYIDINIVLHQL